MDFQRVIRDDAEVAWGAFQNVSGGTISGNYPVAFTTTAASVNGNAAVEPAASNLNTFAGIVNEDVADTEYGRFQAYGYRASARIYAHGTSVTIAAGVAMGPGAGSSGISSTGLYDNFGPVISMEAIGAAVNSPGGYAKVFIRAL